MQNAKKCILFGNSMETFYHSCLLSFPSESLNIEVCCSARVSPIHLRSWVTGMGIQDSFREKLKVPTGPFPAENKPLLNTADSCKSFSLSLSQKFTECENELKQTN